MKRTTTLVVSSVIGAMALPLVLLGTTGHAATQAHRTTYSWLLKPGQSRTFNVPGTVNRIDVAASFEGPPAQTPKSKVMGALVAYDGNTHHLNWVGTNSDGSTTAGDEGTTKLVAKICGTTCSFTIAKLSIHTGPDRMTLVLSKHAGTSADFELNIWY